MFLKLMHDNSVDSDQFTIFPVPAGARVEFRKDFSYPDEPLRRVAIIRTRGDEQIVPIEGDVYVMNGDGKTIALLRFCTPPTV